VIRRRLVGQLGLEPGTELRDLQKAILHGDPLDAAGGDGLCAHCRVAEQYATSSHGEG
jgi:hypothetical protein